MSFKVNMAPVFKRHKSQGNEYKIAFAGRYKISLTLLTLNKKKIKVVGLATPSYHLISRDLIYTQQLL